MPAYRYLHLAHHRYVGDEDLDPDEMFVRLPTRYPPFGYLVLFFQIFCGDIGQFLKLE